MKERLVARLLAVTGMRPVLSRLFRWSGVLSLNYHRIGTSAGSPFDHGLWSADEDGFDAQVRYLKANFDVCVPEELPDILEQKRGRHVLITFDDGYRDNYTSAFRVLRNNGVRATFFVATGFLDSPRLPWWDEIAWMVRTSLRKGLDVRPWLDSVVEFDEPDRERAIRTLLRTFKAMSGASTLEYLGAIATASGTGRFKHSDTKDLWMNWDMVREMRTAGMAFGSHTVSHPILARVAPSRQSDEILGSCRRIADELDEPTLSFSYPVGNRESFNDETRECLRAAGVKYAFSYYGGYRRFHEWDDYDIRRIAIEPRITQEWFNSIVSLPRFFAE